MNLPTLLIIQISVLLVQLFLLFTIIAPKLSKKLSKSTKLSFKTSSKPKHRLEDIIEHDNTRDTIYKQKQDSIKASNINNTDNLSVGDTTAQPLSDPIITNDITNTSTKDQSFLDKNRPMFCKSEYKPHNTQSVISSFIKSYDDLTIVYKPNTSITISNKAIKFVSTDEVILKEFINLLTK